MDQRFCIAWLHFDTLHARSLPHHVCGLPCFRVVPTAGAGEDAEDIFVTKDGLGCLGDQGAGQMATEPVHLYNSCLILNRSIS